ncbi:MAG: type II toxin-antitoxin system RelE/ParE family toxin [Candidatus Nomurabacteria bacterium]|jgi:plasmid stabilization system protein ParE|nr:type II toxin-antitoxin system RelE/ParE family toxin [Candidatus Nomurabacteria bacterium]
MIIKYSANAESHLNEIYQYILVKLVNEFAAVNTLTKILHKIQLLEQFPEIGAPLGDIDARFADFRFLVAGNYLVIYRIYADYVQIADIIYGKSDYLRFLKIS